MTEVTFYRVPNHDDLMISRDGQVKHVTQGILDQHLYCEYLVVNAPGNGSLFVHRLVAMTFVECGGAFEDYVINHRDGNKLNNAIDNLEWVTYSDNLNHAYLTGLRKENIWVKVKNVKDGTVAVYHSIGETARQLGTNPSKIHLALKPRKPRLFRGKYLVVLNGMEFPKTFAMTRPGTNRTKSANFVRKPVPIVVTDRTTGRKVPWPSVERFATEHGSTKSAVAKSIWKNGGWRNFEIEYASV